MKLRLALLTTASALGCVAFAGWAATIAQTKDPIYTVGDVLAGATSNPQAWDDRTVRIRGAADLSIELVLSGLTPPMDRHPPSPLFLLEDQSRVPNHSFTALWVMYGGEDPLLSLLRHVPIVGATLPLPQRVVSTTTVTYRVKLHRQANLCLVNGCVWGELIDAAPTPK